MKEADNTDLESKKDQLQEGEVSHKKPTEHNIAKAKPLPRAPKPLKQEQPLDPSPLQPTLDRFKKILLEYVDKEAIEESYINRAGRDQPTLVILSTHWLKIAEVLKKDERLAFDYVRNLSGVDYNSYMEVVTHLYSFKHGHQITIRVKTDREQLTVPTVSHLWRAANWNEREIYDLLGIIFTDHPQLQRILMPDNWVGYPLRKDYEPLDKEV